MCPLRKDCGKGDVSQSSLWGQIQIILFAKAESLKRKEERVRIFSNQFYSEASPVWKAGECCSSGALVAQTGAGLPRL